MRNAPKLPWRWTLAAWAGFTLCFLFTDGPGGALFAFLSFPVVAPIAWLLAHIWSPS